MVRRSGSEYKPNRSNTYTRVGTQFYTFYILIYIPEFQTLLYSQILIDFL